MRLAGIQLCKEYCSCDGVCPNVINAQHLAIRRSSWCFPRGCQYLESSSCLGTHLLTLELLAYDHNAPPVHQPSSSSLFLKSNPGSWSSCLSVSTSSPKRLSLPVLQNTFVRPGTERNNQTCRYRWPLQKLCKDTIEFTYKIKYKRSEVIRKITKYPQRQLPSPKGSLGLYQSQT